MDIGKLSRIGTQMGNTIDPKKKSVMSTQDRNAPKDQQQQPKKKAPIKLKDEHVDAAFLALVESFSENGLKAEKAFHKGEIQFLVKDPTGKIVKVFDSNDIMELFNNRFSQTPGTLLKKSA